MLKNTFVHIPGIGYQTEQRLWDTGLRSWNDFLRRREDAPLGSRMKEFALSYVEESKKHLEQKNHHFFVDKVPRRELWRAYRDFKDSVAFLDIETTGLDWDRHDITMIGVFDGKESMTFTRGKNLSEFPREIGRFMSIVTYNGARFDIPFIKSAFPDLNLHQLHIDIMYPLRRLGYRGGLKVIEKEVGIDRSEDTEGLSGYDAVILWKKHMRGDENALAVLEEYNMEDTKNLKVLSDLAYRELKRKHLP